MDHPLHDKPLSLRAQLHLLTKMEKYSLSWINYPESEALCRLEGLSHEARLQKQFRRFPAAFDYLLIQIAHRTPYLSVQCRCLQLSSGTDYIPAFLAQCRE